MIGSTQARPLDGQRLLLCVGGGIAAYKSLELVRRLRDAGAQVQVAMTSGAQQFVTPLSFQALSGQPTRTTLWDSAAEQAMGHIELARWADQVIVAPATADLLARLAHGLADDLVSTLCLATTAPLTVAPAMNHRMWLHPATQANVATLSARGVRVVGPEDGPLAEGESGPGRLAEPAAIIAALAGGAGIAAPLASKAAAAPAFVPSSAQLDGLRIVISAGPTFEDLDPVRYVGNRSSGKMGYALAAAAASQGAEVVLVSGPVHQTTPAGVRRIDVRSAAQMRDAVLGAFPADIYIGAAAVADYTPKRVVAQKIKKTGETLTLELVRTPDILAEVAAQTGALKLVVGFAAETHDVEHYARGKLAAKRLDLIIANQVGIEGGGFESDNNAATAYWQGGERAFPSSSKTELADQLLALIAERLQA
ncbi:bifunctional phosphopantothenoylcysteine decarboxylase/phosphopantothenate--cysteine ligase CoaBC [Xanthomonas arboricola pv. juglandis]|uniref:bifunctional phosphopantothenoylcysteine decarboxylase/phosphopantothenate--cysteine ligase CoaBC n=1 Tax=Xanthomonas arboricola TaxID=56448 RepID=UPI0004749947|nr:bifunctional phosphopantothenoylcysteine decarboxylase/phosphopantothenate--cysteine ligase CoaBC [Xanthomonas arboricola]MDN0222409.1 bifunctional phosphopantothenoylcysteine decarboxylase/phosphopantothenate--cysteine ligase CoaBC [Xanthomonas arboricola pv. juglandis]MDN0226657.1 bifunctional phosphopantothenoylcysteine decarboxylase/phosphopantothenate--cysteine ligase CoaBC [Xanthomonas arboricola pv. juglandis]MDN0230936.1 bifunctional phosphopantothenoylcysteine decarboxylase/phosphopa